MRQFVLRKLQQYFRLRVIMRLSFMLLVLFLAFNHASGRDVEVEDYTVAIKAFEDGFYDLSRQQFLLFMEKYPKSKRRSLAQFFLGEISFRRKEYSRAQREFGSFLKKYRGHTREETALNRLGRCYFLVRNYGAAASTYKKIPERFPTSSAIGTAHYWAGESLYLVKQFDQAMEQFNLAIAHKATNNFYEYCLFRRGLCFLETQVYHDAIKDFTTLGTLSVDDELLSEAFFLTLKSYYLQAKYDSVITIMHTKFDKIVSKRKAEAIIFTANAFLRSNKPYESIRFLESIIDNEGIVPKKSEYYPELLYLLGMSFLQSKQSEKGIDYFTRVAFEFRSARQAEDSLVNLAYLYMQLGQIDEAETHYQLYLDKYPSGSMKIKVLKGLARLYQLNDRLDRAIDYLEKAKQLADTDEKGVLYLSIADTLKTAQQYQKAIKAYEHVIEHYKHQTAIYEEGFLQVGLCYYKLEWYDKAAAQLKTFILQFPNSSLVNQARYWLGETYFQKKEYGTAVLAFEEYLRQISEQVLARKVTEKIAFALFQEEKWTQALRYYEQLSDSALNVGNSENILIKIGQCQQRLNNINEAIQTYSRLLTEFPKSEHSKSVRFSLAHLLVQLNNGHDALEALEVLTPKDLQVDELGDYHYLKGQALDGTTQFGRAEKEYRAALAHSSDPEQKVLCLFSLGENLIKQGQFSKADLALTEIVTRYPQSPFAPLTLNRYFEQASQTNDSQAYLAILERATQAGEPALAAEALYLGAVHYFKKGALDDALANLETIITTYQDQTTWFERALLKLGLIHEHRKEFSAALAYYKRIIVAELSEKVTTIASARIEKLKTKATYTLSGTDHSPNTLTKDMVP